MMELNEYLILYNTNRIKNSLESKKTNNTRIRVLHSDLGPGNCPQVHIYIREPHKEQILLKIVKSHLTYKHV